MSIHFISGKPRAGKSLYAVRLIVDELVNGSRPVITNVPLNLGALNEFLQREYPNKSIDLFQRVRLLTEQETREFWRWRPGCTIERLTKEDWKAGRVPDYSGVKDKGVFWAIDELHLFFGARQWMETGQDVMHFLSQHGHLGDTFIGITQAVGNVDKQFRSVTQDFTFIRNFAKEKYGFFKLPGVFMRRTFTSPPTENSTPMETGTFRLNVKGLASCYSTVAGVGIHDRGGADKLEKKKGIPWWVGLGGAAVAAYLFFNALPSLAAHYLGNFGDKVVRGGVDPVAKGAMSRLAPALPAPGPAAPVTQAAVTPHQVTPSGVTPNAVTNKPPRLTGMAMIGGVWLFAMPGGDVVRSTDVTRVAAWSPRGAVIDGVFYHAP